MGLSLCRRRRIWSSQGPEGSSEVATFLCHTSSSLLHGEGPKPAVPWRYSDKGTAEEGRTAGKCTFPPSAHYLDHTQLLSHLVSLFQVSILCDVVISVSIVQEEN